MTPLDLLALLGFLVVVAVAAVAVAVAATPQRREGDPR
ncbi:putative membrane protein [Candidatus Protofrankia californiensis]|uniref:Putative membrane protein n=1 Tax=Candidatus Protofrankia californiensis TaxID=1839754 RepID=A0A1C3NTI3_9ACTN|nr:putative membrane protein [Candidatus Protofrankia californiensis]